MTLSPLELLALVGVPLFLGTALLRPLGIALRTDRLAYLGWAWLAGTLGVAALELLRLVAGLPSPLAVIAPALALGLGSFALSRRRAAVPAAPRPASSRAERLFFAAALGLVLAVTTLRILRGSLSAIVTNDEATFWSLRAKFLFETGGFGGSYAAAIQARQLPNPAYPMLNPLLQLWVFDLAGRITHAVNRLPIQLCSLALVACLAAALRRQANGWIAGALLVLLAGTFEAASVARHAHSDVLVALGALVAFDALERWRKDGRGSWLGLAALAGAFLLWSKHEGVLLCGAFVAAYALVHARDAAALRRAFLLPARAHLWLLAPALAVLVTWVHNRSFPTYHSHLAGVSVEDAGFARAFFQDLPEMANHMARVAFSPSTSFIPGVFWLLVLATLSRLRGGWRALPVLVIGCLYVSLPLVWTRTGRALFWQMDNSCGRVFFQVLPLQLAWIAPALAALRMKPRTAPTPGPP